MLFFHALLFLLLGSLCGVATPVPSPPGGQVGPSQPSFWHRMSSSVSNLVHGTPAQQATGLYHFTLTNDKETKDYVVELFFNRGTMAVEVTTPGTKPFSDQDLLLLCNVEHIWKRVSGEAHVKAMLDWPAGEPLSYGLKTALEESANKKDGLFRMTTVNGQGVNAIKLWYKSNTKAVDWVFIGDVKAPARLI